MVAPYAKAIGLRMPALAPYPWSACYANAPSFETAPSAPPQDDGVEALEAPSSGASRHLPLRNRLPRLLRPQGEKDSFTYSDSSGRRLPAAPNRCFAPGP
jgi:hypothetical protein